MERRSNECLTEQLLALHGLGVLVHISEIEVPQ